MGRRYHSLTAVDGSLVAAGGADEDWNTLSSVEIFGETGWSTASWSLKTPVISHCAVSFQGELVILGGSYGGRKAFRKYSNVIGLHDKLYRFIYVQMYIYNCNEYIYIRIFTKIKLDCCVHIIIHA